MTLIHNEDLERKISYDIVFNNLLESILIVYYNK